MKRWFLASTLLAVLVPVHSWAADEKQEKPAAIAIADLNRSSPVDFQKDILPIFKRSCTACHNQADAKGDLVLETPATILKGGESGAVVVPGKSAESLLLKVASHADKPVMPPKNNKANAPNLKPEELGLIKLWIDQGAKGEVVIKEVPVHWQALPAGLNPIYAVAVSPDGQYVAAGRANQIFIYHVPTKSLVTRLTDPALTKQGGPGGNAHRDLVQSLTFNPKGDLLISGGYRIVKIWRRPVDVKRHDMAVTEATRRAVVSADGKTLAVNGANNVVTLIDLSNGKPARDLTGHTAAVSDFKFSADGSKIITASADKTVRVFTAADGKQVSLFDAPAEVTAVAWLAKDAKFATAHGDGMVRVWDAAAAFAPKPAAPPAAKPEEKPADKPADKDKAADKPADKDKAPAKPADKPADKPAEGVMPLVEIKLAAAVSSLVTMPNNDAQMLAGCADGNVQHLASDNAKPIKAFAHGAPVTSLAVRPDGLKFASAGGASAKLWKIDSSSGVIEIKSSAGDPAALDEKQRLVALNDQHIGYYKKLVTDTEARKKAEGEALTKANEAVKKADEDVKAKNEAFKKATEAKMAADKGMADAEAALKAATEGKTAADAAATKAKDDAKTAAAKATETDAAFKKATDAKAAAEKANTERQAKLKDAADKLAAAKEALAKKADDKALMDAVTAAEQKVKDEEGKAKVATDALAAATKELEPLTKAKADADKAKTDTAAKQQAADTAKAAADKAHAEAMTKKNAADQAVKAQEKPFNDAKAAAEAAVRNHESSKNAVVSTTAAVQRVDEQLAKAQAELKASEAAKTQAAGEADAAKKAVETVKPITTVAFSTNGGLLITGGEGAVVQTWSAEDGAPASSFRGHAAPIVAVAAAADGSIISASADSKATVWDTAAPWKLERAIGSGETDSPLIDRVISLAVSPDGKMLATGGGQPSRSGEVKIWNLADGALIREIKDAHSDTVFGLEFSFDGKYLASCAADKFVKTWTVADGKFVMSFEGHTHHVLGVSWMADGRTLASAGADGVVKVWDFVVGGQKRTIKGDGSKEITGIRFVGVSDTAVTCSGDTVVKTVKENGSGAKNLPGTADAMYAVSVTPDGKVIAAGGEDSVLRVWNAAGAAIATFEAPKEEKK